MAEKKRFFIRLAYDGTNYCGWQNQNEQESVQGTIESALSTLYRAPQKIVGCGRTDTGVHADDFYAHWDFDGILEENTCIKLNSILPRSIAIKEIFEVPVECNSRYNATKRTYHYFIHTQKNPFRRLYSYEYTHHHLNLDLMKFAASELLNYNEFLPLIKLDKEKQKTHCTLFSSHFEQLEPHYYRYEISANRFLHNMVRRIVGTLMLIGREKLTLEEFQYSMKHQSPMRLINLAPANGLHLIKLDYPFIDNAEQD
ncbi:MAG: tRNA pseudouridine(38-40) synthase TruA [Chitinophagales bacterium]|jgi:tRNA pseudouridine38-40 synthase|nr:tRNA pseudouridine(38-40) synthase TruA [Sphingobacteriales bacterium]